jgi:hypothetical protein
MAPLAEKAIEQALAESSNSVAELETISIGLAHGSEREIKTKAQLEHLLSFYNLRKYTFTYNVMIDERSIPHSHPVLTLHTRHLNSDDQLLSTYVHEQLHWYLDGHLPETLAAENNLRKLYPKVPVGYPDGADDEESTYLHLIVCYMEMEADRELIGAERTENVMKFWASDHYRWVYRTVLQDEARIGKVVAQEHLELG